MNLKNDDKFYRLVVRLNRELQREHDLRLFLEKNVAHGYTRKELMLQLFETALNSGYIDEDMGLLRTPIRDRKYIEGIIKKNEEAYKESMKEEKQQSVEDVDEADFNVL